MKKSLATVLFGVALLVAIAMKMLKMPILGPLIILGMAAAYFGLTVVIEAIRTFGPGKKTPAKVNGKKVQD